MIIVGWTSVDDFDVTDKSLAKIWTANVKAALDCIKREREPKCYEERLQDGLFRKGDKSLESRGSGLGLYPVQTLLDQYGGFVAVEENDPEGTVFIIRLWKVD